MKRILLLLLLLTLLSAFCGAQAEESQPGVEVPSGVSYSRVYEPETSWSMSATVAWEADSSVFSVAGETKRPGTVMVYPTPSLRVEDREGRVIAESLDEFVKKTSGTLIPALYLRSRAAGTAVKAWMEKNGPLDCFVVSTPDLQDAVRDAAELLHVRGMIDFSHVTRADFSALAEMAACVNGAHGKTVILSQEAATLENIVRLQSLAATVWVRTASDTESLLTMYTRGVHGVVVEDARKAIQTLEFFQDDAPTLLRIPLTIGHRGDPSTYMENTLDSAAGAVREGADSVENDIQLSADGELFILHDPNMNRLFNRDVTAEELTLAELKSIYADWDHPNRGIRKVNEVTEEDSRYGKFYGQDEKKRYTVPTLEEYIQTFRESGIIHDTEIKSESPDILPVYKALIDRYNAWDQFFTITFNPSILNAVYEKYPEISVGALGFLTQYDQVMILFGDKVKLVSPDDQEAVLENLFAVLDAWNATANPSYENMPKKILSAARHRGLTVWPWTYMEKQGFAEDYLFGVSGLTTDYPWWTENLLEEIESKDYTLQTGEKLPKPRGRTKRNAWKTLDTAEAVRVEDRPDGTSLMLWRYKADLTLGGERFGSYYLYSEPFLLKSSSPGPTATASLPTTPASTNVPGTRDGAVPLLWLALIALGALGMLSLCLAGVSRAVQKGRKDS